MSIYVRKYMYPIFEQIIFDIFSLIWAQISAHFNIKVEVQEGP
jgi:hypothetical protein